MKKETQRLYYIDWLRVLAMISIFFFHADRFFDDFDWHVKNPDHNLISTLHVAFFSQWMMPLFFILSGAAVFYSLKFRSGAYFHSGESTKNSHPPVDCRVFYYQSTPDVF